LTEGEEYEKFLFYEKIVVQIIQKKRRIAENIELFGEKKFSKKFFRGNPTGNGQTFSAGKSLCCLEKWTRKGEKCVGKSSK
jgi:hypothetical protein